MSEYMGETAEELEPVASESGCPVCGGGWEYIDDVVPGGKLCGNCGYVWDCEVEEERC